METSHHHHYEYSPSEESYKRDNKDLLDRAEFRNPSGRNNKIVGLLLCLIQDYSANKSFGFTVVFWN